MPLLIKRVVWNDDIHVENKKLRKKLFPLDIELKEDVTLIVGCNGTGKTRFLRNLYDLYDLDFQARQYIEKGQIMFADEVRNELKRIRMTVESASDAPVFRVHLIRQDKILAAGEYSGDMLQLASHWMSSGEAREILIKRIENCAVALRKDGVKGVMLLDELDDGLDYKLQAEFAKILKESSDVLQFVVVSHNIPLISQFDEVFDIERKKYVPTSAYLRKILPSGIFAKPSGKEQENH